MKKLLLVVALIMVLAVPVFAQWSDIIVGDTILHKSVVDNHNIWFAASPLRTTSDSQELSGFNSVRADYDVTGSDISINTNIMCSNDSLWVSGDSITLTADTWAVYDLMGCKDYNWYIESVSAGDSISIYLTPYTD